MRRKAFELGLGALFGWLVVTALLPGGDGAVRERLDPDSRVVPPLESERATEMGLPEPKVDPLAPASGEVAPSDALPVATPTAEAPGILVYGIVSDEGGALLADARVGYQDEVGDYHGVNTDEQGRYALGPLDPGAYDLDAWLLSFQGDVHQLVLAQSEALVRQDFTLSKKWSVDVILETRSGDSGLLAISKAGFHARSLQLVPVATSENPGSTFEGIIGSLSDPFGIGGFWPARRSLQASPDPNCYGTVLINGDGPAWMSLVAMGQVITAKPITRDMDQVTFLLEPKDISVLFGELTATLIDGSSGRSVTGKAWLAKNPFPMGEKPEQTDEEGRVHFPNAPVGEQWLIVKSKGRATVTERVTLRRGELLERGEILMHKSISIKGVVLDESGKPLEASLTWGRFDSEKGRVSWVKQQSTVATPDGAWTIGGLEPDVWYVKAEGPSSNHLLRSDKSRTSAAIRVDARAGSVTDVELRLQKATIFRIDAETKTQPWPVATVTNDSGVAVVRAYVAAWPGGTPLHLLPGTYKLEIHYEDALLETRQLTIGESIQIMDFDLSDYIETW